MDREDKVLAFVQGRMDGAERRAFEAEMAQDRTLAAEIAAMQALRAEFAAETSAETAAETAEAGWARFAPTLEETAAAGTANANRAPRFSLWQTGALIAASLALWQVVAVPLITPPPDAGFRPVSEAAEMPTLQILFAPGADIVEISRLLADSGGTIVSGPGAIGLYRVAFDTAAARDAARAAFENRPDLADRVAVD